MSHWTDPDPTRTFDGRATLYEAGRAGYPEGVVDLLLGGLERTDGPPRVVDVGAGTGRLARLFAARGCPVVAVEPNAHMRAAAPPFAGLEWAAATAEATGLPDDSAELLTVAQAFHWVDTERGLPEFRRVLVPGGRLAVIWNDRIVESPFERAYHELVRELKPAERRGRPPRDSALALIGTAWFDDPELSELAHDHPLDSATLIARTLSLSYAPLEPGERAALERRLRDLHELHADESGRCVQRYSTRVHLTHAKA